MKSLLAGNRLLQVLGVLIIVPLLFLLFINNYLSSKLPSNSQTQIGQDVSGVTKTFTVEELKRYDGTDENMPIYLALDGLVYDVTAGKQFYAPGGAYHYLAGKDSSIPLRLVGGDVIKEKYPVVGKLAS